ncbi:MAG: S8 family serine peptidase [Opitutales bacterium]|nr:S8 family serine peptidase [Opitutales bacterium]
MMRKISPILISAGLLTGLILLLFTNQPAPEQTSTPAVQGPAEAISTSPEEAIASETMVPSKASSPSAPSPEATRKALTSTPLPDREKVTHLRSLPLVQSDRTNPDPEIQALWPGAVIEFVYETEPIDEIHRRVTFITPPDLPYRIRIEDLVETDSDGKEHLLSRREAAADHILVRLNPGTDADTINGQLLAHGAQLGLAVNRRGLHRVDILDPHNHADAIPALTRALNELRDSIRYAEPDYIVHPTVEPNDPSFLDGTLWALNNTGQDGGVAGADISATTAWNTRTDASSIIVGVVDSGIRTTHEDITANLWVNPTETADGTDTNGNGFVDDIHGIDAITHSGNLIDDNGHGTHVAGTIGAVGNNDLGITGVAWDVQLMGLRFLAKTGGGTLSDAIICIEYAIDNEVDILNNSWGGPAFSQALLDTIMETRDAGIIFVAAAGNSNTDVDFNPVYPAAYGVENIVTVASTTRTDERSSFSSYGQGTVDLAAPGSAIYSLGIESDTDYRSLNGTSMASPHVAGALALLKAEFPGDTYGQLINRLYRGVDTLPDLAEGIVGTGGRLNLANSITSTDNTPFNNSFSESRTVHGDVAFLRTHNLGATYVPGEPALGAESEPNNVWFSFTPVANGQTSVSVVDERVVFSPLQGNLDLTYEVIPAVIGVFTGDSVAELSSVGIEEQSVSFTAEAGVTYHIAVAGIGGEEGLFMLDIIGPPRNSDLANAIELDLQRSVLGTNRNALAEPDEPAHAGETATASIWYRWTAGFTGRVGFSTRGSTFNTVAAVYTGPASDAEMTDLSPVASNINAVGATFSRVDFQAIAGETYYIAVDGYNGAEGNVSAIIAIPPANDDFNNPIILSGTDVTRQVNTFFASREEGEPKHWPNQGNGETVWYNWTAPENGRTTLSTSGTFSSSIVAVYTGNAVDNLTLISSDGAANRPTSLTFEAIQGTTYRIAVEAWDIPLTNVPLNLQMVPVPENELFANATVLEGFRTTVTGNNQGAARESGEPDQNFNGSSSVWYTWTAPASGEFGIYGERLDKPRRWNVVLNVFTGDSVDDLTHVKEDFGNGVGFDAYLRFNAVVGTTYHLQVTSLNAQNLFGGEGPFRLDLRPNDEHHAPNALFANATELDGSTVYNYRTTSYGLVPEPGEPAHGGLTANESIWWKFTVPSGQGGRYAVGNGQSEGVWATAVYRLTDPGDPSFANLEPVADNVALVSAAFPEVAWEAIEGETYYIAMERSEGVRGRLIFNFQKVPDNYVFAGAETIPGDSANFITYNYGAVYEEDEPLMGAMETRPGERSLWWEWTAPDNRRYVLDTFGSRTPIWEDNVEYPGREELGFATRVGVFTGSSLGSLTTIATNTRTTVGSYGNSWFSETAWSRVEFQAVEGTTYRFLVNGLHLGAPNPNNTNTGQLHVNFFPVEPPANSTFAGATEITDTDYHVIQPTLGATKESGEPDHGGINGGRSLWWKWTATETGPFVVSTAGNLYDDFHARRTGLGVYTGSAVNNLTTVASDQNSAGFNTGNNTWSSLTFNATEGTTYYFGADAVYPGNLSFIFTRPAPNDDFANATVKVGSRWTSIAHHLETTVEPDEPRIDGGYFEEPDNNFRSVWYQWTAPVSGEISLDTMGSQSVNLVGVFTGSSVDNLTPIIPIPRSGGNPFNGDSVRRARMGNNNGGPITFNAVADTTYYISLQGSGFIVPSSGPYVLTVVGPPSIPFAPENFLALREGPSLITLEWDDVAVDEEFYELERSTDGIAWEPLAELPPESDTFADFDTAAETDYFYRLRAVNSVGESTWVQAAVTEPAPPNAPANLIATANSTSQITISWTGMPQTDSYRLERSVEGYEGPWTVLAESTTSTTYIDSGLDPAIRHYYRVAGENEFGFSPWSEASVRTFENALLVFDPFTDGGTTQGADPLDVHWSRTGGTFEVVQDSTLDPESPHNVAELVIGGSGSDQYLSFPLPEEVNLAVGESLEVSFKLRHTAQPRDNNHRTGVAFAHTPGAAPWSNEDNRDYYFFTSYGNAGTEGVLRRTIGAQVLNNTGNTVTLASNLASVEMGTSVGTVHYEVARTGSSTIRLRYQINGGPVQEATDSGSDIITSYNRIFFRFMTRSDAAEPNFRLDDVTVEYRRPAAPTPLEQWRIDNFGTDDPTGIVADLADPDGDGIPNLLEYALGGDPLVANPAIRPTLVVDEGLTQFSFFRAVADLDYHVEYSFDLNSWSLWETNPGNVAETVLLEDLFQPQEDPSKFFRLRVE